MPNFSNAMRIPTERAEQLRIIGKRRDLTIVQLIEEFIRGQIEKGHMNSDLPGYQITRTADTVEIVTDQFTKAIPVATAGNLATAIRALLKPSVNNPFIPILDLGLMRRGTSLKLVDPVSTREKTLTHSVANDLANLLMIAATAE